MTFMSNEPPELCIMCGQPLTYAKSIGWYCRKCDTPSQDVSSDDLRDKLAKSREQLLSDLISGKLDETGALVDDGGSGCQDAESRYIAW